MNATGLPIPVVPAAAPAAVEPAAAPVAGGAAPTDFVLALAQMLGASVPVAKGETSIATAGSNEDPLPSDAQAAALALLPLPIAQPQPQLTPGQQATDNFDPLEMLGLTGGGERAAARDAAILQALTERLAGNGADTSTQDAQLPSGALSSLESTQQRAPTTEAAQVRSSLQQPVGTRAWADELGARLTMMTDKGQHTASLRLSPEHLGPLEVRIAMRDDQASVWFGAAHADTRAAIEHALPRLRELFAEQGMSLADAGVFREPPKQQFAEWQGNGQTGNAAETTASTDSAAVPARVQLGLLDAYA